jgi:hypothetical protein
MSHRIISLALATLLTSTLSVGAENLLTRKPDQTIPETRSILFGQGTRDHLVVGWARNEWSPELRAHFVWANATDASISFTLLDVVETQFLVKLLPFPSERQQQITVLMNGTKIAMIEPEPAFLEYRFVAPKKTLHRGKNRLTFRHTELSGKGRPLATAYSSLLFGPNCLRLRPRGKPEPAPGTRREDHGLIVRGPIELSYQVARPAGGELEFRVRPSKTPANLEIAWIPGTGEDAEVLAQIRIERPWFRSGERTYRVVLPSTARHPGRVQLGVYTDSCHDAATDIFISNLEFHENANRQKY